MSALSYDILYSAIKWWERSDSDAQLSGFNRTCYRYHYIPHKVAGLAGIEPTQADLEFALLP